MLWQNKFTSKQKNIIQKILTALSISTLSCIATSKPVSYLPWYEAQNIDSNWLYTEQAPDGMPESGSDAIYHPITLPHTWNAIDSLETAKYRRATSWYRRYINLTPTDLKKRLYIRFGAAGQEADVYVNGKKELPHKGGYTAFALELTKLVNPGRNRIDVRVTNAFDELVPPHSADYTFYGGLYRQVFLLRGPKTGICRHYYASPAIRLWSSDISTKQATLYCRLMLDTAATTPPYN